MSGDADLGSRHPSFATVPSVRGLGTAGLPRLDVGDLARADPDPGWPRVASIADSFAEAELA
jgi:hypothetical protein